MTRWIAGLLILIGLGLCAYAVVGAIGEITALYEGVLTDPMGEPAVPEEDRSQRMLTALTPAVAGLPLLLIGTRIWWRTRLVRRFARR